MTLRKFLDIEVSQVVAKGQERVKNTTNGRHPSYRPHLVSFCLSMKPLLFSKWRKNGSQPYFQADQSWSHQ